MVLVIQKNIFGTGNTKEYFHLTNKLLFEGKLIYGIKNGKGKEYDEDGNIQFDGEYLNGERWNGYVKYEEGGLIFKGEYLNGKIWGGKGYVVKAISYMS